MGLVDELRARRVRGGLVKGIYMVRLGILSTIQGQSLCYLMARQKKCGSISRINHLLHIRGFGFYNFGLHLCNLIRLINHHLKIRLIINFHTLSPFNSGFDSDSSPAFNMDSFQMKMNIDL